MGKEQREGGDAAQRLLSEAQTANDEGRPEAALELLDRAIAAAQDPELLLELDHLRNRILIWMEGPLAVHRSLLRAAYEIASTDPDRAAMMSAEAVGTAFMAGDSAAIRSAASAAERHGVHAGPEASTAARIAFLEVAVLLDASPAAAVELGGYVSLMVQEPVLRSAHQAVGFFAMTMLYLERHAEAQHIFSCLVDSLHEHGPRSALPYPVVGLAELAFRSGDWSHAYELACEATSLGDETRQPSVLALILTVLAQIEAGFGKTEEAREHLDRSDDLRREHAIPSLELYIAAARGFVDLSLGRWDEAVPSLERARDIAHTHGVVEPGLACWAPNLIEAYARLGRKREAETLLERVDEVAQRTGRSWCLGALDRCRGILEPAPLAGGYFRSALEHHARSLIPLETARTQLAQAEAALQAGDEGGTIHLEAARATFSRLGAQPWLEQVLRVERLAASAPMAGTLRALTAQEVEVASVVAQGATNKEAAAKLFVSVKTIEAHLGSIYRKIGIRSRTELAVRVNAERLDGSRDTGTLP